MFINDCQLVAVARQVPYRQSPYPTGRYCCYCGWIAQIPYPRCWYCHESASYHHDRGCPLKPQAHQLTGSFHQARIGFALFEDLALWDPYMHRLQQNQSQLCPRRRTIRCHLCNVTLLPEDAYMCDYCSGPVSFCRGCTLLCQTCRHTLCDPCYSSARHYGTCSMRFEHLEAHSFIADSVTLEHSRDSHFPPLLQAERLQYASDRSRFDRIVQGGICSKRLG